MSITCYGCGSDANPAGDYHWMCKHGEHPEADAARANALAEAR